MSEEMPNLIEMFSYIFKFLFTLAVLVIIIILSLNLRTTIDLKSTERLSSDVAENYVSSAYYKSVFDKGNLTKINNTIIELVSDCSVGTHITITSLKDGAVYDFGYRTGGLPSAITVKSRYNTAIRSESNIKNFYYETIEPAVMNVELYKTKLTEISCLAQKAYENKMEYNMTIGCFLSNSNGNCAFPIQYSDKDNGICVFQAGDPVECKYLPGIKTTSTVQNYEDKLNSNREALLRAIPIKQTIADLIRSSRSFSSDCSFYNSIKSGKNDNVQGVVLCIEKIN